MIETIKHIFANRDKEPLGHQRSSEWPKVREEHLKKFPACAACGGKEKLNVHHMMPFHLDPSKELDPANLITLCEANELNCHLKLGHLGNFTLYNPDVKKTTEYIYDLLITKHNEMEKKLKDTKITGDD